MPYLRAIMIVKMFRRCLLIGVSVKTIVIVFSILYSPCLTEFGQHCRNQALVVYCRMTLLQQVKHPPNLDARWLLDPYANRRLGASCTCTT